MVRNIAIAIALMLFAAETVLAASISTRVRILENKVTQFENLVKKSSSAANKEQLAKIEENSQDISLLKIRIDNLRAEASKPNPKDRKTTKSKQARVSYLEDPRFTDSRYSYP